MLIVTDMLNLFLSDLEHLKLSNLNVLQCWDIEHLFISLSMLWIGNVLPNPLVMFIQKTLRWQRCSWPSTPVLSQASKVLPIFQKSVLSLVHYSLLLLSSSGNFFLYLCVQQAGLKLSVCGSIKMHVYVVRGWDHWDVCWSRRLRFYMGKLMMWFAQSWQWEHVRCWAPLGGLHLLCLMMFSHIPSQPGRGSGPPDCVERACFRKELFTAPNPSPTDCTPPPVPPGPGIDTNKAGLTLVHSYI